jgi:hypothetical protein
VKAAYVAQATYLMDDGNDRPLNEPLTGGTPDSSPEQGKRPASRRGTTNGNARGGSDDRRRRREWLIETYRADYDLAVIEGLEFAGGLAVLPGTEGSRPACRCYRCGALLTSETVTVDRIVPGCQGGTYRRGNIRPACGPCNSETGGRTRGKR